MCNACGFLCCASDEFGGCGCDSCGEPECLSLCDMCGEDNLLTCACDDDDVDDWNWRDEERDR